jgi:hypothetical protein
MAAGKEKGLAGGRPKGGVHLLSLAIESIAGQGHPVLPADQPPQASYLGVKDLKGRAVAMGPDHALMIGRDQLSVFA